MKKKKSIFNDGMSPILTGITIGSIPMITDSETETNIKEKTLEGLGNVAKTYPARGSMMGAGMVLKSMNKLKKKTKMKGGLD